MSVWPNVISMVNLQIKLFIGSSSINMNCEGDFIPININKILSNIHDDFWKGKLFVKYLICVCEGLAGSPPKSIQCHKQRLANSGNGSGLLQREQTAFINPGGRKQPLGYPVEKRFHHNEEESIIIKGTLQSMFAWAAAFGPESANAQHDNQIK